ncbi:MAG TPA: hypothetical protein VMW80_11555 [Candidatus Dormibacteraeota bacterium]|nr:hypothetical protein [Candidatus Dormibacteraeota bacterium]
MKRSGEAAALLAAAIDSVGQLEDAETSQLTVAALDAIDRLQERLQLLTEAHRIAERHRAADSVNSEIAAVALAEPLGIAADAVLG